MHGAGAAKVLQRSRIELQSILVTGSGVVNALSETVRNRSTRDADQDTVISQLLKLLFPQA